MTLARLEGYLFGVRTRSRGLLAVVLVTVGLLGVGLEAGWWSLGSVERTLPAGQITEWEAPGGLAYLVRVPGPLGASVAHGSRSRLLLLEDGVPLRPFVTQSAVDRTKGCYGHWGRRLVFSSTDGSDPRSGAHVYTTTSPWIFMPGLAWLLLALGVASGAPWGRDLVGALEAAAPLKVALALALATLALRWLWADDRALVSGSFVGELSISDAASWLELSDDFARGTRTSQAWEFWGARRPLTYVINGSWGALFGLSRLSLTIFNALCSALGAALIFDALRRLVPNPVALVGTCVHVLSRMDAALGTTGLSEPSGYFLSNVALWLFALALTRESRDECPNWTWFLGGLVLALGNLSRPLTLLAAGGVPVAVFLVRRARGGGLPWRPALRVGLCCLAGLLVALLPWLIRQRVVHGIFTLSDNTAEMLSSAADPGYGTWSPEVSNEAARAGHRTFASRSAFFNARFRESLRTDPGFYLRNIISLGGGSLTNQLSASTPFFALGLLIFACWPGAPPGFGVTALLLGAAYGIGESCGVAPRVWPWVLVGAALSFLRGDGAALLGLALALTLLAIGAVAAPYPRFVYSLHWLAVPLALLGPWSLARWAASRGPPTLSEGVEARGGEQLERVLKGALLLGTALLIVGLGFAVARRVGASPAVPRPLVSKLAWRESAMADEAALPYRDLWPALVVERGILQPNFVSYHPQGSRLETPRPAFASHDTLERTYFVVERGLPGPPGWMASHSVFPGRLPADRPSLTMVGVWVREPDPDIQEIGVFEVVAYTTSESPAGARWTFGLPSSRNNHGALLRSRQSLGQVYLPLR